MKKLSKQEFLILTIALGLAAVWAIREAVINPVQKGRAAIDRQLRLNQIQLMKNKKILEQRPDIERRYKNLTELIGAAGSDGSEISAMVARIESAAGEANIHIANMQPQKVIGASQKGERFFSVELQVEGQWVSIVKFFSLVQSSPNYYFINELNLEKYQDTAGYLHGRIVLSRMRLVNAQ